MVAQGLCKCCSPSFFFFYMRGGLTSTDCIRLSMRSSHIHPATVVMTRIPAVAIAAMWSRSTNGIYRTRPIFGVTGRAKNMLQIFRIDGSQPVLPWKLHEEDASRNTILSSLYPNCSIKWEPLQYTYNRLDQPSLATEHLEVSSTQSRKGNLFRLLEMWIRDS